jgi:hypothetical protein
MATGLFDEPTTGSERADEPIEDRFTRRQVLSSTNQAWTRPNPSTAGPRRRRARNAPQPRPLQPIEEAHATSVAKT